MVSSDSATKAELIATLQVAAQNIPFSCAENIATCNQEKFPDSSIAENVTVGPTKMSCLVSHGLGPYFNQMIIREIEEEHSYFTLYFDETVTAKVKNKWIYLCIIGLKRIVE